MTRTRHSGHNDASRLDSLARQFQELASLGPLGLWPLVTIDTSDFSDISSLADEAVRGVSALLEPDS